MVNVGAKRPSELREATAEAVVRFPAVIFEQLVQSGFNCPKGPLLNTARLAGINAAKQTATLIPLCHQVPLAFVSVDFDMESLPAASLRVLSVAQAVGQRTGVEMEALTAAAVASLTIYDMCKALHKNTPNNEAIMIQHLRLLAKTGGGKS